MGWYNGEIPNFTGISSAYEAPNKAEIHIKNDNIITDKCIDKIIEYLNEKRLYRVLRNIELEKIVTIAKEVGDVIMKIYEKDFTVEYKDDKLPLTGADTKANEIICSKLEKLYPNIPIMSEENKQTEYEVRKNWKYYWCIDPIDGAKEFIDNLEIKEKEQVSKGTPLKPCMVATGEADIYPRLAPTMKWDTAADAIVRVTDKMTYFYETNQPMIYNKENLLNPWFIVKTKNNLCNK